MKRKLALFIVCLMALLNLVMPPAAHALPFDQLSIPGLSKLELPEQQKALFEHLETEIIPQLERIFNPTQKEQFKSAMMEGASFRKAFKAITLTPEQKTQLADLLKSLPKKDLLATLTPEQKKSFFLKKKEMFMPTAEEITERINTGLKTAGEAVPDAEAITEKITAGLKKKASFMPSVESITEKIKQAVPTLPNE